MQSALDYILDLFSQVVDLMQSTVFSVWGYSVSVFWLFVSISFMGFLFSSLLPFVARAEDEYQYHKAVSERNDKRKRGKK